MLEKQAQELEENKITIEDEIENLREFEKNIADFSASKESSMLASLGKGVYAKTNLQGKELFVEVGKGIVVKKTSEETRELIEIQIKKLEEARMKILRKLEIYSNALLAVVNKINSELPNE